MTTTPEFTKVSSMEFDKNPEHYRAQATPGHIVQVIEPGGATTVIMSEADFAGFQTTIELLSNPHDAQALTGTMRTPHVLALSISQCDCFHAAFRLPIGR